MIELKCSFDITCIWYFGISALQVEIVLFLQCRLFVKGHRLDDNGLLPNISVTIFPDVCYSTKDFHTSSLWLHPSELYSLMSGRWGSITIWFSCCLLNTCGKHPFGNSVSPKAFGISAKGIGIKLREKSQLNVSCKWLHIFKFCSYNLWQNRIFMEVFHDSVAIVAFKIMAKTLIQCFR